MLGLEGIRAEGQGGNILDCLKIIKIRKGNFEVNCQLEKGGQSLDPHGGQGNLQGTRKAKIQEQRGRRGLPEMDTGGHSGRGRGERAGWCPSLLRLQGFHAGSRPEVQSAPRCPPHSLGSCWLVSKVFQRFSYYPKEKKTNNKTPENPKADLVQVFEHLQHLAL